jgi:hypothetical protein
VHKNIGDSILKVCSILIKNNVEYLIVGGTAVALYGYFRWSLGTTGKTSEKYDLLDALEELGQDVTEFKNEQSPNPKSSFFRFEMEKFTLDFLPKLKELSKFRSSFEKKEIVNFNGTAIYVISFDDLIKDKMVNSRPKDLADIKQLIAKRKSK